VEKGVIRKFQDPPARPTGREVTTDCSSETKPEKDAGQEQKLVMVDRARPFNRVWQTLSVRD